MKSSEDFTMGSLKFGRTRLMALASNNIVQGVAELLELGEAVDAKDDDGITALVYACNAGALECAQLLVEAGADVNSRNRVGGTPLFYAAAQGREDVVKALLGLGADHTAALENGVTPLMMAASAGHGRVVNALLAAGADANSVDALGRTAWHYARDSRRTEMVGYLAKITKVAGHSER